MLFVVDTNSRTAEQVEADTFSSLKVTERFDLQEWAIARLLEFKKIFGPLLAAIV